MGRTEIRFSVFSQVGLILLIILFLGVELLFIIQPPELIGKQSEQFNTNQTRLIAFVFLVIFLFALKSAINQLTRREPALVLDKEGITDNTSEFSHGLIRWAEISHVSHWETKDEKFICLHIDTPPTQFNSDNTLLSMAKAATHLTSRDSLNISAQGLSVDFDTLYDQIYSYHQQYTVSP